MIEHKLPYTGMSHLPTISLAKGRNIGLDLRRKGRFLSQLLELPIPEVYLSFHV